MNPTCRSVVLLALGIAITGASCEKAAPVAVPPSSVQAMEIKASSVPLSAEFIGQLDSPQNVEVRARVEGFVDKVLFTEGTEVKEGDPLFALDKEPFLERLAAAEGMLAEARAATNKYEKDVARLKPLAEKRAIPKQDLDNAIASVDVGKANVQSAESRVESAKIELGYCDVKSPVAGLIGAKQVSVGSLVGKGALPAERAERVPRGVGQPHCLPAHPRVSRAPGKTHPGPSQRDRPGQHPL
jgi:membrane fusion protein (multidrug efflux system)